jgi:hypothetical protein
MPWVTIRGGVVSADGDEAVLREYLCDWPGGCPNVADHVVSVSRDLGAVFAVCREHFATRNAGTRSERTHDSRPD